jgi:hypothetical protein
VSFCGAPRPGQEYSWDGGAAVGREELERRKLEILSRLGVEAQEVLKAAGGALLGGAGADLTLAGLERMEGWPSFG